MAPQSSTRYRQTFGSRRERPQYLHVAIGAVAVFFILPLLNGALKGSALISIMTFNLLFVLLTFPLHGPLWCKMLWLGLGNIVGLAWNLIQLSLMIVTRGMDAFQIVCARAHMEWCQYSNLKGYILPMNTSVLGGGHGMRGGRQIQG